MAREDRTVDMLDVAIINMRGSWWNIGLLCFSAVRLHFSCRDQGHCAKEIRDQGFQLGFERF